MQKFIILIFIILPFCLNGQFSSAKYYFEKCKVNNEIPETKCVDFEMSTWIYENIIKKIPKTDLKDKNQLALSLRIDTNSVFNSCILSWKEKNRYYIKDIPVKYSKIVGFKTAKQLNVTYTFKDSITSGESLVYIRGNEIFKVVQFRPSLDTCIFTLDYNINDCAKVALFSAINKNIKYSKEAEEKNIAGKIPFGLVIDFDGYISDFNILRFDVGNGAEDALLNALKVLKEQKIRFLPGFQGSKPVNVALILKYPFDISK